MLHDTGTVSASRSCVGGISNCCGRSKTSFFNGRCVGTSKFRQKGVTHGGEALGQIIAKGSPSI